MSEILTIDTASGIQQVEQVEPLQVFGEDYFMLGQRIPEYTGGFPAPALVTLAKRMKMTMKLYSIPNRTQKLCDPKKFIATTLRLRKRN